MMFTPKTKSKPVKFYNKEELRLKQSDHFADLYVYYEFK